MTVRARQQIHRLNRALTVALTVVGMAGLALVGGPLAAAAPRTAAHRSAGTSPPAPGSYVALTPHRLLDTRTGAPLAPRANRTLTVAGQAGVPLSGVGTVVLTATAVADPSYGYLTIYAHGGTRPNVASLNYVGNYARSNQVFTQLGADGAVTIYNGANTSTNVTIDVSGYYLAGDSGSGGSSGSYVPVTPARLLDTRTGLKPAAGSDRWVTVAGSDGVPARVSAVVLNVAALQPTGSGFIGINTENEPGYQSTVYFAAGQSVSNLVIVTLEGAGRVLLKNYSSGHTHFTADVYGYFSTGAPAALGMFGPDLDSDPVIDTTEIGSNPQTHVPIPGRGSIDVQVGGVSGVPESASAVALNVTANGETAPGYVTSYATGSARPVSATLDFTAGYEVTDLAVLPLGTGGKITFFNGSLQPVDLIVAAVGFVGAVPGPMRWSSPQRVDLQAGWFQVSCPSAFFCLGIDNRHQYLTFDGTAWTSPAPTGLPGYPQLVSCASPAFCVALSAGPSEVYRAGAWSGGPTLTIGDFDDQVTGLSCVSSTFCVAVGGDEDGNGHVWLYDGATWSAESTVTTTQAFSSVSCVSAQFCVAAGQGRQVAQYDGHTWTKTTIAAGTPYFDSSVSCTSTTFCLAASGQESQSFDVTTWSAPQPFATRANLYSVSVACAGPIFCAGLGVHGAVGFNTGSGWTELANLGHPATLTGIQCPSAAFCMVTDSQGYVSTGIPR